MNRLACMALVTFPLVIGATPSDRWHSESFPEVQKETERRSFTFSQPGGSRQLEIDNVEGAIDVTGYEGDSVQVEIEKTIRGRSKDDIERAKEEVRLQVTEKGNRVDIYVDGPFRCQDGSFRSRRTGYRVTCNFHVKAPRECDLFLRTVNEGDIRVGNVSGKFDVENINGGIQISETAGPGRAHAINGAVKVLFIRNPVGDCSFSSLNGDVDVALRQGLSADLWFKTFNGEAYTDYELVPLPSPAAEQERHDGKFVYKSSRFAGARAGKGGPQLKFDTLNGNIHVTAR